MLIAEAPNWSQNGNVIMIFILKINQFLKLFTVISTALNKDYQTAKIFVTTFFGHT